MTASQIFSANQILTVELAKSLVGKTIIATSPEYRMNTPHVHQFVIGDMISSWDNAALELMADGNTRQQYWASYMTKEQVDEQKTKLFLLDNAGNKMYAAHTKYHNFFDEPTFTGSDADRPVFFIEL